MQIIRPVRVERTYTQKLEASPGEVFPLLCPVRETEWVSGWKPLAVYSNSGLAEPDCIFVTGEGQPDSYWLMTERDPETLRTTIVKVTPGMTAAKITIVLLENADGGTDARVTYMYTALSEEGEEFVRSYSEDYYAEFMAYWETTLNEYLRTGRKTAGEDSPPPDEDGAPSR